MKKIIPFAVGVVAVAAAGAVFWFLREAPRGASKGSPEGVEIIAREAGAVVANNRRWPTERILRQIGNSGPETLAEVGKVGEYPIGYLLSPDKKNLLVNLETKLQILNLETKELKDLFVPKRQVMSAVFSPDGKELFVWDQKFAPPDGDNRYFIHRFVLASGEDRILKEGISENPFVAGVWRDDGKIILHEAHGESAAPHYFDLATGEIVKTPGEFEAGFLSAGGRAMAVIKDFVEDVCNDFSGDAPSTYNVVDPVSGKFLGTFGAAGYRVAVLGFSPNAEEVLYQTEKPWTNPQDCDKKTSPHYYKTQIRTGQSGSLADPGPVLKSWNGSVTFLHEQN